MAELARVGNWVGELTATTGTGDIELGGALNGFTTFSSMGDGEVYYALVEGDDREAGKGTLVGTVLQRTDIYSTLVDGVYNEVDPQPIELEGLANIFCTFNERAFRELNQEALTVFYDNTISGASSTNVGEALDELFSAPGAREFYKIKIEVAAGQSLLLLESSFESIILIVDGVVKQETSGDYSVDYGNRSVILAEPLTGSEKVEAWVNQVEFIPVDFKMQDATDAELNGGSNLDPLGYSWDASNGGMGSQGGLELTPAFDSFPVTVYANKLDIDGKEPPVEYFNGAEVDIYLDGAFAYTKTIAVESYIPVVDFPENYVWLITWDGLVFQAYQSIKFVPTNVEEIPLQDGDAWVYNSSEQMFKPTQIGSTTNITNGIGSISIDSDGNISSSSKSIFAETEEDGDLSCLLGNGGGLYIISGTENPFGTGVADSGGFIRLKAGDSKADDGGAIILQAGDCVHENSRAGSVTFEAGSGQYGVNVDGGSATIQAGKSDSGEGGSAFLKGGSNSSSSENAGSVYIESGSNSDDASRSGSVFISGGGNNRGQIILGRDISYIKAGTELNMEEATIKGGEATFDTLRSDTLGTDTYDLPIDAPSAGQVMVAQSSSETAWVTPDASVPTVVVTEFPASPDANTLYIKVV